MIEEINGQIDPQQLSALSVTIKESITAKQGRLRREYDLLWRKIDREQVQTCIDATRTDEGEETYSRPTLPDGTPQYIAPTITVRQTPEELKIQQDHLHDLDRQINGLKQQKDEIDGILSSDDIDTQKQWLRENIDHYFAELLRSFDQDIKTKTAEHPHPVVMSININQVALLALCIQPSLCNSISSEKKDHILKAFIAEYRLSLKADQPQAATTMLNRARTLGLLRSTKSDQERQERKLLYFLQHLPTT